MSQTPDWQHQLVEFSKNFELSSCHTALGMVENSTLLLDGAGEDRVMNNFNGECRSPLACRRGGDGLLNFQ